MIGKINPSIEKKSNKSWTLLSKRQEKMPLYSDAYLEPSRTSTMERFLQR